MKVPTKPLFSAFLGVIAISLIACSHAAISGTGGGGGGGGTGPFTIGGTVTGLTGTGLILQDNGADLLTITGNSTFTFKTTIASGGAFSVAVNQSPTPAQTCTVANGSGTAAANVTNVAVTCSTGTVAIGVSVSGLSGTGLALQDVVQGAPAADFLTITGTTTNTQFKNAVPFGQTYAVTVSSQPTSPAQTCTVTNGTGTATSGVAVTVQVACSLGTISIGGSISGYSGGTGFVLQDNGGDSLTITSNGKFTFPLLVPVNSNYTVTVFGQPAGPNQTCTITNGSGKAAVNITNVNVVCPAVFHPIAVNVVGVLGSSGNMQLIDSGAGNLFTPKNGSYTFPTQIAHGSSYDVKEFVAPGTQAEDCIRWDFSGVAISTPISPIPLIDCGHDDWAWIAGSNSTDQLGNRKAVVCPPSTKLTPGGTQYSATWTDNNGNLWLLTGFGFTSTSPPIATLPGYFGELWEYTSTADYGGSCSDTWTLINAVPLVPSPVERWGALTWTDPSSGHLMLFGGQDGPLHFLNDLWSFDPVALTWTFISGGADKPGIYGGAVPPTVGGTPGGRWGASGRLDSKGNFWMFGGFGCDSTGPGCSNKLLNDLWKYDPVAKNWTWVSGNNTGNQAGAYGTKGTPANGNMPPGREGSAGWLDNSDNFWMFGGYTGGTNGFNDLWKYDPVAKQWTWESGSIGASNTPGNFGNQGVAAATNVPGARWLPASWTDVHGNLWLFGGEGFDVTGLGTLGDLWEYTTDPTATTDPGNPAQVVTGQWVWVRGHNSVSQPGVYGLIDNPNFWPHVTNNPGTRFSPSFWTVKDPTLGYEFYMFGGEGFDATGSPGIGFRLLNDTWRYLPYP